MSGSGPAKGARRPDGLGELAYQVAGVAPQARMFARRDAGDQWESVSASTFLGEVTALAKGLIGAGISAGDRVVLVCGTRYEWVLVGFAVWAVRAVLVPVPAVCSAARLRHVLRDCRPAAVVLEDGRHAATVASVQHELTELGRTWRLDTAGLAGITRPGAYMDASAVRFRREETTRADPAVVMYPLRRSVAVRGAVLTHGNLLASAEALVERLGPAVAGIPAGQAATVMGVPLADIHGHSALVACVMGRVCVGFPARGAPLLWEIRSFRPTVLLAVPSLLEAAHRGERMRARDAGRDTLNTFDAATELAVRFDEATRKGAWQRVSRVMYDWVFTRIRDVLGGRVRVAVCAGSPLSERMDRFYNGAGIPVFQAFGTVESAGAFVASGPGVRGAGTAGVALPESQVRVDANGEVFVRGPGVFTGYWDAPEASRAAFVEGWLATGVRGQLDAAGFLSVSGWARAQASRVAPVRGRVVSGPAALPAAPSPGGAPAGEGGAAGPAPSPVVRHAAVLERQLREHPLISQVMVVVEGRPYATALITLLREQVEYWRLVNGRPLSMPAAEITADPALVREVRTVVHAANGAVPAEARVRAFHVLAEEFSAHSGLVSPSGELRREVILRAFAEEIDGLYQVPEVGGRA